MWYLSEELTDHKDVKIAYRNKVKRKKYKCNRARCFSDNVLCTFYCAQSSRRARSLGSHASRSACFIPSGLRAHRALPLRRNTAECISSALREAGSRHYPQHRNCIKTSQRRLLTQVSRHTTHTHHREHTSHVPHSSYPTRRTFAHPNKITLLLLLFESECAHGGASGRERQSTAP